MEGMTVHAVQPILNPTCPSQPQQRTPTMLPLKPSFLSAPTYPPSPLPRNRAATFLQPPTAPESSSVFFAKSIGKIFARFLQSGPSASRICQIELQIFCIFFAQFLQSRGLWPVTGIFFAKFFARNLLEFLIKCVESY